MREDKDFREFLAEQLRAPEAEKKFYNYLLSGRIATEIYHFRKLRGLSQKQFADAIGTSQPNVARLESGDYGRYSLSTLMKIAEALDVELVVSFREKIHKAREAQKEQFVTIRKHLALLQPEKYDFRKSGIKTNYKKSQLRMTGGAA